MGHDEHQNRCHCSCCCCSDSCCEKGYQHEDSKESLLKIKEELEEELAEINKRLEGKKDQ